MTYHSRARKGPTPIPKAAAIACWALFIIAAILTALSAGRLRGVDPAPEAVSMTWALAATTIICFVSAVGVVVVEGMRQQGPLAPGVTLVLAGMIGTTFTPLMLIPLVVGVAWAGLGLLRVGNKPYYL